MPTLEPDDVPPPCRMPDPVNPAHRAFFDAVYAYARHIARKRGIAANPEEVAHDVTVRLFSRWQKRPGSVVDRNRQMFIRRNVKKESLRVESRSDNRDGMRFESLERRGVLGGMHGGAPQLVAVGRADDAAMYDERLAVLHAAMQDLGDDSRRYVYLNRIGQWTHAEIAVFHGVSEDVVDRALAKANAVLIPIMQEYDDDGRVPPHVAARLREEET